MRASVVLPSLVLLVTAPAAPQWAGCQEPRGGTVTGIVTDSASLPIPGAEVIVRPGARRTFTDSAGRYTITTVDAAARRITARKLGWVSRTTDFDLAKGGELRVDFQLARHVTLDTVRVAARRSCAEFKLTGFDCRRANGAGLFLDYPDIDDLQREHTAEIFRGVPGLNVALQLRNGFMVPAVTPRPGRCLYEYVDGLRPSIANPIPERSADLASVEVYQHVDSMALADVGVLFGARGLAAGRRCVVILYWTGKEFGAWRANRPIRMTEER
jgi:hypothetical protein